MRGDSVHGDSQTTSGDRVHGDSLFRRHDRRRYMEIVSL